MSEEFSTIEAYYDTLAESYAENIAESPTRTHLDWPAVRSLLPAVGGKRVLDAGCGPGTYAGWLAERGADVVGVDVSEEMVEVAEREFGDVADFRRADIDDSLDFADDGSFDVVLCQLTFSHLPDVRPALAEFVRVLDDDGVLVLSTHHPFWDFLVVRDEEYPEIRDAYGVSVDPEVLADGPPDYHATERYEIDWGGGGCPYHRRPLGELLGAITDAGFAVTDVVEPDPEGEFREAYPDVAAELDRLPSESLCLRAELS